MHMFAQKHMEMKCDGMGQPSTEPEQLHGFADLEGTAEHLGAVRLWSWINDPHSMTSDTMDA
jgi:hypothetical protein